MNEKNSASLEKAQKEFYSLAPIRILDQQRQPFSLQKILNPILIIYMAKHVLRT